MKILQSPRVRRSSGFALILILGFIGIGFMAVTSVLRWSQSSTLTTDRRNQYHRTLAAAEAATEKIVARIAKDFQSQGEGLVYQNLPAYRNAIPTPADDDYWKQFEFADAQHHKEFTTVERLNPTAWVELNSQYKGLRGAAATYRVLSNARQLNSRWDFAAGVQQDLQVATIPVFQFAIFASVELEINPGPKMNITGRVHGNTNIYAQPISGLTYDSDVTSASLIVHDKHPNDPTSRTKGPITYKAEHDSGVSSLTLPIGTNNSPDAVYAILQPPPANEDPRSPMGQQRYYNKSDLILEVSNSGIVAKSGIYNGSTITLSDTVVNKFVKTNASFYDAREAKTIRPVDIDVAELKLWAESPNALTTSLNGRVPSSIYVLDKRTLASSSQPAVRMLNGSELPRDGLTVATQNPLFVKGHYNAPAAARGTSDTSATKPASLVGDAINILSGNWNDANSTDYSKRNATDTTVNAAILGGNVPTGIYSGAKKYSGGVENFPRFLENWGGDKLTYNGSMVLMFHSKVAKGLWGSANVYSPPDRNWAFDLNFLDPTKLPPGTPMVRALIRGEWTTVAANSPQQN